MYARIGVVSIIRETPHERKKKLFEAQKEDKERAIAILYGFAWHKSWKEQVRVIDRDLVRRNFMENKRESDPSLCK